MIAAPFTIPMALSRLLALLVGVGLASFTPLARSQDLVGCSLVGGQLSCVPGVSADPQAQIRALRAEIAATLNQEDGVQQQIDQLQTLVLAGEAQQGALLRASLGAEPLTSLPASAFHWYRLAPGGSHWVWLEAAQGPTYLLGGEDVDSSVMLVVVESGDAGVRRQATPPVGPVLATP